MRHTKRNGVVLLATLSIYVLISHYFPKDTAIWYRHIPAYSEMNRNTKYEPSVYDPKWTYSLTSSLCTNATDRMMAEDLFCMKRPTLLINYKNPCWTEVDAGGAKVLRCMPYFQLLGADKCGSTDLFSRILRHPEMEPASCVLSKECNYWCCHRYGTYMKKRHLKAVGSPLRMLFNSYVRRFTSAAVIIEHEETDGYHSHITGIRFDFRLWQSALCGYAYSLRRLLPTCKKCLVLE